MAKGKEDENVTFLRPNNDENMEVVNWMKETMESHSFGHVNEVMGVATIYEHYQLVLFSVALHFESLQS